MKTENVSSHVSQCPVSSFEAALEDVAAQIELYSLYGSGRDGMYNEIARIIADVYVRPRSDKVKIAGEWVSYAYLQDVFSQLTSEHVEVVADQFERYPAEIRFKRAFLRTALFNSVFEMECGLCNQLAVNGII